MTVLERPIVHRPRKPIATGRVTLGGYAAKQCARKTHVEFDPSYAGAPLVGFSDALEQRIREGVAFEAEIAEIWPGLLGDRLIAIPGKIQKELREAMTLAAMQQPSEAVLIWNPRLPVDEVGGRVGEPDFLVRLDLPTGSTWAPGDVKHHKTLEGASKPQVWRVTSPHLPGPQHAFIADLGPGSPHRDDLMQLAHYRRILEALGFPQPEGPYLAALIGTDGWLAWFDLDEPYFGDSEAPGKRAKASATELYDRAFAYRVAVAERALAMGDNPTLEPLALPEWKAECKECPFRVVCKDELTAQRHITLLPGITTSRARPHYANGVSTSDQLAHLNHATAVLVDAGVDLGYLKTAARGCPSQTPLTAFVTKPEHVVALSQANFASVADLARIHEPTAAYAGSGVHRLADAIDQARVSLTGQPHRARGVDCIPELGDSGISHDVDIEDNGHCYLIGVFETGRSTKDDIAKVRRAYRPFVSWDPDGAEEAKVFAAWWRFTQEARDRAAAKHTTYRAWFYTAHETRYFRHLVTKYAGLPGIPTSEELEAFFAGPAWRDLHPLVRRILWPTPDVTLKSTAVSVGFRWSDATPGGGNSVAWHEEATTSPDPTVREAARRRLLAYNEDDVRATKHLRRWIAAQSSDPKRPGDLIPSIEVLDRKFEWRHR